MKKIILYAATAMALAACVSEMNVLKDSAETEIAFSTYVNANTRAEYKTEFVSGDILGLYACKTVGDYTEAYASNFMDNVPVTKGDDSWTYSPLSSWPDDENEHLSFIAYYPRSESSAAQSYPFTVTLEEGNQVDPLCCTVRDAHINDRNGAAINGDETDAAFNPNSGPLSLKFNHMLARVKVLVKLDKDYAGISVKLNSLTLNDFYTSGTYAVANDLNSGSWTASGSLSDYAMHSDTDEEINLTSAGEVIGDILMLPQELYSTPTYLEIAYSHNLREGGEMTVTKKMNLPNTWEPNKIYNYTVNLSLDVNNISVTAEIAGMDDAATPPIGSEPAEAVDLGLSVKWASCDFGVVSPYVESPVYVFTDYTLTKPTSYGKDETKVLPQNQDRAQAWGANWYTPTRAHWNELYTECTWEKTTVDGVEVYKVTGPTGNSIFLRDLEYWTSEYYMTSSTSNIYVYHKKSAGNTYYGDSQTSRYRYHIRPIFK